MIKTVLSGHWSFETAYCVEDYPCGFRARCTKKFWLEYKPKKGYRFCIQTTNSRNGQWNAPKHSTYLNLGAILFLDEYNYVQWTGISYYDSIVECQEFQNKYNSILPEHGQKELNDWIVAKIALNKLKEKSAIAFTITTTIRGTDGQVETKEVSKHVCEPEKVLTS